MCPSVIKVVEASVVLCSTVCDQVLHYGHVNFVRSHLSPVGVSPQSSLWGKYIQI